MIPIRTLRELTPRERETLLRRSALLTREVQKSAEKIVEEVRERGDAALRAFTKKFDRVELDSLEVPAAEIDAAEGRLPARDRMALRSAFDSIVRYHKQSLPRSFEFEPVKGITLGALAVPFETAGIYVPGGRAAYPSSVLMAAAPAVVAGVPTLVLCTPPDARGAVSDSVLFASKLAGVRRVFRIGGAQAVAAMAFGTESVPACEIIVGPGNAYVTAAKKIVQDLVAIDFLAGPTEILVLSDGTTSPAFIAADLAAQAEHDPAATALLVTTSRLQAEQVVRELEVQVPRLPRADVVRESLKKNGAAFVVESIDEAMEFANRYAPEHLSLSCRNPVPLLKRIRHAGAVFVGEHSPVAVGDYGVGPSAVLPTLGQARIRSGLTASTFLKTISYEQLNPEGLRRVAPTTTALARLEGLDAHLRSIEIRLADETTR